MKRIPKRLLLWAVAGCAGLFAQAQTFDNMDVGFPDLDGSTSVDGDTITVTGAGADIWGTCDQFQYYWTQKTGDFDVRVRVEELNGTHQWAKAELMIRVASGGDPECGDPFYAMMATRSDGNGQDEVSAQMRPARDASAIGADPTSPPTYPNTWLRVAKVGTILYGYSSSDGADWTLLDFVDTGSTAGWDAFPSTVNLGLAVTSHDVASTATATFQDFGDTPAGAPTITLQPEDATAAETGSATFMVEAAGSPAPTFQWMKDGANISGATGPSYTFSNAAMSDNGAKFSAKATNSAGSVTSSEATLTVLEQQIEEVAGWARTDYFEDIPGVAIDDLLLSDKYLDDEPDNIVSVFRIDLINGYGENYGSRTTGWLIPSETGNYDLFMRSDDAGALYLSDDDSFPDPLIETPIAEETACCNAFLEPPALQTTFAPIPLQAGRRYGFTFIQKQGTGGDWGQVAMRKDDDPTPAANLQPIGGENLVSMADVTGISLEITQQPLNTDGVEGTTATLSVVAEVTNLVGTPPPAFYQWMKDGEVIPDATATEYTTPDLSMGDDATYTVAVDTLGISEMSDEAVLTVVKDTFPPKVAGITVPSLLNLTVVFDEPVDRTTAETASNYTLDQGLTVGEAVMNTPTAILLTTSAMTEDANYVLTVNNVEDRFGNPIKAGTQLPFKAEVFLYEEIILEDGPIAYYRFEETSGSVAANSGTAGDPHDGLYMVDVDEGTAKNEPGPRPGAFLGFAPDNLAATFDGVADWIDTQNQFLQNLGAFSLEYWVRPVDRDTWPTRVGIVGQNDAIEYGFIDNTTIQIWTPGGGSLNTTYALDMDTAEDTQGGWHHVATIATGTGIENYFDGVFQNEISNTTDDYGGADFNVHIGGGGVFDGTGNWFTGQIDEVAIFDKAIPAERVEAHFLAGKYGTGGPPPPGEDPMFTSISVEGDQVTFAWEGDGVLEEAGEVTGTWSDSANQANPQTVTAEGIKFYRLRKQ